MDFDYFYGRGADQFAFYQIPKILITDEKFAGITMESKILYSLMLDRASLSAKNGWLDEDGKVFIYYKLDRIMADMHCANQKASIKLDLEDRIAFMREKLETETTIKEFDRQVFESIVDYVIVGGYNEEGNADPSMITFVYRTGFKDRKDANHFKPERLNAAKKKTGSGSHTKEVCQSDDTSSNSSLSHSGLQSLIPDDSNILQSHTSPDAC